MLIYCTPVNDKAPCRFFFLSYISLMNACGAQPLVGRLLVLSLGGCAALVLLATSIEAISGVRGSRWSETSDEGGCSLPQDDYVVMDAVALGQSVDLGDLAYRTPMCGQVLHISCGGTSTNAVVASTCDIGDTASGHCALDMIAATWSKMTNGAPPGITKCSVVLSHENPIKGSKMICYFRPNTPASPYYVNLGVMNVGGEMLRDVTVDGIQGTYSNGIWYAVNAAGGKQFSGSSVVEFSFESGRKVKFNLGDCRNSTGIHIFR